MSRERRGVTGSPQASGVERGEGPPRLINDAHCHFFSERFFAALGRQRSTVAPQSVQDVVGILGWDPPGSAEALADRWVKELDAHGVGRAALIASVPGDEESVAAAVARHPSRFVGFFMLDPTAADAVARTDRALTELRLRVVCLFPAMHRYPLHDSRVRNVVERAQQHSGAAIFVHCGALSVGVRARLGLPSRFDVRFGNPLDVQAVAADFPSVPFIIPHFGAGLFRETLLAADLCPNIYLDTSSSNRWLDYHPGMSLADAFAHTLKVVGAERLLFGTDSSFFPRGWQAGIHDRQVAAVKSLNVDDNAVCHIFALNFGRLFPA